MNGEIHKIRSCVPKSTTALKNVIVFVNCFISITYPELGCCFAKCLDNK